MKVSKKISFSLILSAILLIVVNCGEVSPQEAAIKIDQAQKFQTITGWEATAQSGEQSSPAFNIYKDKLFAEAVNDLGINRLRLEIRSGAENPNNYFARWQAGQITEKDFGSKRYEVINDNDDPFVFEPKGFQFAEFDSTIEKVVLPVKKLLAARGETLFINLNYVDFGHARGSSNIRHHNNPEEYAELILAAYQHIQSKYGFVPDAVEVILEPDNETGWTGTDIGKAIVATANRLQKNNFKPAFIVPATKDMDKAPVFIDEIAKIPGAMQFVTEFSYHRYGGVSAQALEQIAARAAKYNKQTAMLEWIEADYQTLHEDLKIGRNSAWQQFTLGFPNEPDNGAQYFLIDDKNNAAPKVTIGSRTKFLRQYFRYIRAGAQRIGAETTNPNLDPLAFINSNGKYVVVIKAETPGTVSLLGLPTGNYSISYTTKSQTDVNNPDVAVTTGETFKTNIPSSGVLTIFQK